LASPEAILKQYWGYSHFRPLQKEIIEAVLSGKDTLGLLPTGGGKSICFQVPAMMQPGICIVISPLISLMKDQVDQLRHVGIKAYAIYTGMTRREIDICLDNCIYGEIKFLYVSPERLNTELFVERVKRMKVNLLVVDEAHCIAQWGYDFRPSYLEIAKFREILPSTSLLALTATATQTVREDIIRHLNFINPIVVRGSFVREKLSLSVRKVNDKDRKLLEIMQKVKGSTIVYVNSRKRTKDISLMLHRHGYDSDYYHAGLSHDARVRKQEAWQKGRFRIMVATNAFGMGINKSNVRLVVHYDLPGSPEAYYQEAGRAGRDGHIAYAVVLFTELDGKLMIDQLERNYPSANYLKKVYQAIANYLKIAVGSSRLESYDFDINAFAETFDLNTYEVFQAIKRLEEEGLLEINEGFYHPSKVTFNATKEKLYEYQIAHEEMDLLIKAILRLYGGEVFSDFMPVSEQHLAKFLNTTTYSVIKKLETMHRQDVLVYDKVKDKPQIAFLTSRYDATLLPVDAAHLKMRKKAERGRLDKMLHYLQNDLDCRMIQVSTYFGEVPEHPCGICDVCIAQKNARGAGKKMSESTKSKILELLRDGSKRESELLSTATQSEKEHVILAIKQLLESDNIFVDKDGKLAIRVD